MLTCDGQATFLLGTYKLCFPRLCYTLLNKQDRYQYVMLTWQMPTCDLNNRCIVIGMFYFLTIFEILWCCLMGFWVETEPLNLG